MSRRVLRYGVSSTGHRVTTSGANSRCRYEIQARAAPQVAPGQLRPSPVPSARAARLAVTIAEDMREDIPASAVDSERSLGAPLGPPAGVRTILGSVMKPPVNALKVVCPNCAARRGVHCQNPNHKTCDARKKRARLELAEAKTKYTTLDEGSTSVRTISGGGVETNRRKH